jgi:CelD/BcsL family acetyltransferase involved in cellulose biosynthesis
MTKPMLLAEFTRLPPATRAVVFDGLSGAIDPVAEAAPETHRFLRYQWFAAALAAYGGQARTILIEHDSDPVIALPMIRFGPAAARLAAVPGCYWPFRSFPASVTAGKDAFDALVDSLGREVNALRIGPVNDGDPSLAPLLAAARAKGWAILDRFVADSWVLDMASAQGEEAWPRTSTLRKNRFHEKHLAAQGALAWRFLGGADLAASGFDALASIEEKSWIATDTDGRDAKFTAAGHGSFWRTAAQDPVLAGMMSAGLLLVDDAPAAFSFDLNAGDLSYAIANSYDPAFAKHSPGRLLSYRNLAHGMSEGISRVDWGAGDSGYKSVIGAEQGGVIRDWLLVRPGLPALLGRALRHVWERSGQRPTSPDPIHPEIDDEPDAAI